MCLENVLCGNRGHRSEKPACHNWRKPGCSDEDPVRLKKFFFFNEWMKWKNGKLDYSRKESFCLLIESHSHDFPVDCSPPGSSVHGMLQAKILEWVTMPSSRGSSQSRDQTQVSHTAGRRFTIWATREALYPKENSCSLKNTVKE